jgi:hypothetical protein
VKFVELHVDIFRKIERNPERAHSIPDTDI